MSGLASTGEGLGGRELGSRENFTISMPAIASCIAYCFLSKLCTYVHNKSIFIMVLLSGKTIFILIPLNYIW